MGVATGAAVRVRAYSVRGVDLVQLYVHMYRPSVVVVVAVLLSLLSLSLQKFYCMEGTLAIHRVLH